MAHLDQAVVDDFDVPALMAGVRGKRGRYSGVTNRGNMVGRRGPDGFHISINVDPHPVISESGHRLSAAGRSARSISATLERSGETGTITFSTEVGRSPKFVRGIVKIALSQVAYFLGPEVVLDSVFDPIRNFVRDGSGKRHILLTQTSDDLYRNIGWVPYRSEAGTLVSVFRLGYVEFCVDLSPGETEFPKMKAQAQKIMGKNGWSFLPLS